MGREGSYPLIEWGMGHEGVAAYCKEVAGVDWPKSACHFCLSGDTEVVTRDGIRPIRELTGGFHNLLVPQAIPVPAKEGQFGLSGDGRFQNVEVLSFGVQPLFKITMTRGRQRKVVHATAEHRWFVHGMRKNPGHKGSHPTTLVKTTAQLVAGDKMRSLLHKQGWEWTRVPFAIAQGFVYGDGTLESGERPASLPIYANGKDEAILPYFAAHEVHRHKGRRYIYGLPRSWKCLPDIGESRAFLLSWLAGYFAADGDVSKEGQAVIRSASLESIRFARDVLAVCGFGHGMIRSRLRSGFGGSATVLYSLTIDIRGLPRWFFLIHEHWARVESREERRCGGDRDWIVESVKATGRMEEVFCAVVPGVQAFGLADGLMTGNCPFSRGREEVRDRILKFPNLGVDILLLEHVSMALNENMALYADRTAFDTLGADPRLAGVLDRFQARLASCQWSVYRIRRAMVDGVWDRSVEVLFTGTRDEAEDAMYDEADGRGGLPEMDDYGTVRVPIRRRTMTKRDLADGVRAAKARRKARVKKAKPAGEVPLVAEAEEFLVLAPSGVAAKARTRFEGQWRLALTVLAPTETVCSV